MVFLLQILPGSSYIPQLTNFSKFHFFRQVFTWGCNDEGALGRPTNNEAEAFTPGLVDRLKGVKIVQVSAGDSHTAALSEGGTVYGWGIFRVSVVGGACC